MRAFKIVEIKLRDSLKKSKLIKISPKYPY